MSILDSVRAWLSPKQSVSLTDQKLERALRASMEIVSAYGAILEQGTGNKLPTIKRTENDLPYSKQSIAQAIGILQQAIKQPRLRALIVKSLSPEEAQHVLSSQFERGLESGLVFLDTFVPAAEATADQRQWEDVLKLADKIDAGMRSRIENTSARAQDDPIKKEVT
jgi:hypothetical protein